MKRCFINSVCFYSYFAWCMPELLWSKNRLCLLSRWHFSLLFPHPPLYLTFLSSFIHISSTFLLLYTTPTLSSLVLLCIHRRGPRRGDVSADHPLHPPAAALRHRRHLHGEQVLQRLRQEPGRHVSSSYCFLGGTCSLLVQLYVSLSTSNNRARVNM